MLDLSFLMEDLSIFVEETLSIQALIMAGMCCGVGETETSSAIQVTSKSSRRRRIEFHRLKFVAADLAVPPHENGTKRRKLDDVVFPLASPARECENAVENCELKERRLVKDEESTSKGLSRCESPPAAAAVLEPEVVQEPAKFGMCSVCGRRRDMEDAVAIHPSFFRENSQISSDLQFYGVYDGHGCSHVAIKCKDRMHEILKDELQNRDRECSWKETMMQSFSRMDREVTDRTAGNAASSSDCRCELQTPQCDAVGSTAIVAVVTPDKIVVSNCGDSRAVLCRNGVAIPLSTDHKPDRPDELVRIQEAGGRVIYWDGARVLGVLAMSRAIGDNYLKPFVIPEPEVTVTDRTPEDECLILASDGLWDVVSNETACGVASMCVRSEDTPSPPPTSPGTEASVSSSRLSSDKACSDASILLTKLALARHSTDNVSVVVVDLRRNL